MWERERERVGGGGVRVSNGNERIYGELRGSVFSCFFVFFRVFLVFFFWES